LPMMMHAPHEERTDRALRQAGCVDGHAGLPPVFPARPAQPTHRLAYRSVDGHIIQTLQETIQRREVGHAGQPQRLTKLAMLAQPNFGLAKGPVLVTHQTENRKQLRLVEQALAETASITRQHRLGDLQGHAGERQESDFGHRTSCLDRKQQSRTVGYVEFSLS
jgi:hypothetical protein